MRTVHRLLLLLVLILAALPVVQQFSRLIYEKKLNGFFNLSTEPEWSAVSAKSWSEGSYQQEITRRTEDHTGFRRSLFRIHNEYDYRLFGITHAEGFIRGKNGFLFEEDYIHEYTGKYFIGKATVDYKLKKLSAVSHRLQEAGVPFLLVFEPGKASYFREYIPDRYLNEATSRSNYDYMKQRAAELGIPFMDMNSWFISMKDTSKYPLFPRYGMHWSIYGSAVALDTIMSYTASVCGKELPGMNIDRIELSDSMRWTDRDIGDMLNLIFPLVPETLAYPLITFDTSVPKQLSVLVIADSYFINLINNLTGNIFREQEYWYYNSKLYPHIIEGRDVVYLDKSNLREKLLQFDIILLMVSEINLHCGFWNFADEAYRAFYPESADPYWYPYENTIRNNREWFRYMVRKADQNFTSVENAIRRDAVYLHNRENH